MSRLRLLLAWLVMAALPLQGFAAASMLFCGMEQAARVSQVGHSHAGHVHGEAASSASSHDHAAHGHASPHGRAKADPGSGTTAQADQDPQGHACSVCASCCHVVAVGGVEALPQAAPPPGAQPSSPIFRVQTRTAAVPDKPPRV